MCRSIAHISRALLREGGGAVDKSSDHIVSAKKRKTLKNNKTLLGERSIIREFSPFAGDDCIS